MLQQPYKPMQAGANAEAMCKGPVSPEITKLEQKISAAVSLRVVLPAKDFIRKI